MFRNYTRNMTQKGNKNTKNNNFSCPIFQTFFFSKEPNQMIIWTHTGNSENFNCLILPPNPFARSIFLFCHISSPQGKKKFTKKKKGSKTLLVMKIPVFFFPSVSRNKNEYSGCNKKTLYFHNVLDVNVFLWEQCGEKHWNNQIKLVQSVFFISCLLILPSSFFCWVAIVSGK